MWEEEKNMQSDACIDSPSKKDYTLEDFPELLDTKSADWISNKFPDKTFTVFNQKSTPGCTRYWLWHIINAYNITEREKQWDIFTQIDPLEPWNRFCSQRWYYNTGSSLQSALDQWKKELYITWYIAVNDVEKAKLAIDKWLYIYTGSSNGDWTTTKKTGTYTKRTDWKFVWHAWNIIDRDSIKWFKCTNSYWPDWGKEKWFFWLPYDMWDETYTKYIIIDKDDTGYFNMKKNIIKAKELLMTLKEFYTYSPKETQDVISALGKRLRIDYPDLQSIK